jgi:cysteine desulfuration protein SufE
MSVDIADTKFANIADIEEDLAFFDDWEERYRYLIDLGKALPEMPPMDKCETNLVQGCQSQVWLKVTLHACTAQVRLQMDSDAIIVRGLIALIGAAFAGKSPEAVIAYDIEALFVRLDLLNHLSMARGNGLRAMVAKIVEISRELQT